MSPRPPALAAWLLARLLDRDSHEAIAGDLDEEFCHVRRSRGRVAASRCYWAAALRSIVSCRLTGERRVERRRMDFDGCSGVSLRDLLKPSFRQFRDHPLYALAVAGTLALAIGVGAVTMAVVKRAYFDPLPYRDDATLHSLLTSAEGDLTPVSPHVVEDLRASASPFTGLAGVRPFGFAYAADQFTETITGNLVTTDYFAVLGVSPAIGRVWNASERDAIVISWAFWSSSLAADPDVISRSIVLDGRPRTIVGVMPRDFVPPYFWNAAVWAPLDLDPLLAGPRTVRSLSVFARRDANASAGVVDAYLATFSDHLQRQYPAEHGAQSWVAPLLRDELVATARPAVLGAGAAALLLLLAVAANIAGLSTAHAAATRQQLAIRSALGATRSRLFGEQLAETMAVTLLGSAAGVAIAYALTPLVVRDQPQFMGRLATIRLDLPTMAVALVTGVVIGLAAAVLPRRLMAAQPSDALRTSRGGSVDRRLTRTRTVLVTAQVALALVLLVGAGLLIRTVQHLSGMDLGFAPRRLVVTQMNLPLPRYQTPESQIRFEQELAERAARMQGVEWASPSVGIPIAGGMMAGLAIEGDAPGTARREIAYLSVAPDYMSGIGATIVAGRGLAPTDRLNAPRVVIVNETMARMFWPQGDAVGAQIYIGPGTTTPQTWITVVGVFRDIRTHGPTERVRPAAFGSTLQYSWPRRHLTLRLAGAMPATLASDLRAAVHAIDPAIAVGAVQPLETLLTERIARHRLASLALTLFGSLALVLSVSGVYAVVALTSRLRQREYAIRIALGARAGDVRWLVFRQALLIAGAGIVAGAAAATGGTRILEGLLHGVTTLDRPIFAAAGFSLLLLAALAAWQPARHAGRVDPIETLKAE